MSGVGATGRVANEELVLESSGERHVRLREQPVELLSRVPERVPQLPHVKHVEEETVDRRVPEHQDEVQVVLRVVRREAEQRVDGSVPREEETPDVSLLPRRPWTTPDTALGDGTDGDSETLTVNPPETRPPTRESLGNRVGDVGVPRRRVQVRTEAHFPHFVLIENFFNT